MSDNEDTAAALGYSEVLSVKHSVGPPVPEFAQRPEEGTKVPSSARRQDTGDVFPDDPARPVLVNHAEIDEGQVTARVSQSLSKTRDREGLAGRPADEQIDSDIWPLLELRHVAEVRHRRKMVLQYLARELLNLAEELRLPP